jgi:DNA-binding MarR family transcriptional regulator
MTLDQADFEHLLELRTGLRRFLRWSEQQAMAVGLTPAKHQLLLAIKGHLDPAGPTIGEIAEYLVLRHHSAVGLVDRAAGDGLVKRIPDPTSKSVVRVTLTAAGTAKLDALAETHLQELAHLAPTMRALWQTLEQADGGAPHPAARPTEATGQTPSIGAAVADHVAAGDVDGVVGRPEQGGAGDVLGRRDAP